MLRQFAGKRARFFVSHKSRPEGILGVGVVELGIEPFILPKLKARVTSEPFVSLSMQALRPELGI